MPPLHSVDQSVVLFIFSANQICFLSQRFHIYTLMEQTLIVERLLKQLKVDSVHILAHDVGDSVTQELIARQK